MSYGKDGAFRQVIQHHGKMDLEGLATSILAVYTGLTVANAIKMLLINILCTLHYTTSLIMGLSSIGGLNNC